MDTCVLYLHCLLFYLYRDPRDPHVLTHHFPARLSPAQHGFGGSPEQFRAIAKRHHATLLMVCPNMPESTVYRARSPGGFYDQLAHGKRFDWLEPVAMPAKSPIRVWKIK